MFGARTPSWVFLAAVSMIGTSLEVQAERLMPDGRSSRHAMDEKLFLDPPQIHLEEIRHRARAETLWWGGYDGSTAIAGGTWDFEDGTLQGWTSIDHTDIPIRFRRIATSDCTDHADPVCPVISRGGSQASLWVGAHEDEATALCWPGGQGYGNSWGYHAMKQYNYSGSGNVTLSYDYFVDSETGFDFTYVYVIDNNGIQSGPFNTCQNPNGNGFGYSGGHVEGTEIGEPSDPARDQLIIDSPFLPDGAAPFEIDFNFDSDPLYSDAIDSFAGVFNSFNGPFGVDNVLLQGVGLSDLSTFEQDANGFIFSTDPLIGAFMQVAAMADLDEISVGCQCPLTVPNNDYAMVAADISQFPPNSAHPRRQHETLRSPPADLSMSTGIERLLRWDVYQDLPTNSGVGYKAGFHYYPWTCPETGVVGWTLVPAFELTIFTAAPLCLTEMWSGSALLPSQVDSLSVMFDLVGDCADYGVAPEVCTGPEQTNQSPYWDNIQIGVAQSANAPPLALDYWYQDCYPRANSLIPTETARMYSFYDNNRADGGDQTNANMGDSTVVLASTQANSEVYMNYRVYPGVGMGSAGNGTLSDPFFSECGEANALTSGGGWAVARMDTAENATGLQLGLYASYHLESSCGYNPPEQVPGPGGVLIPNRDNKILPDDLFTPGTTIEYFFTSRFTGGDERDVLPDTVGGFYLEVEVLPGYLTQADVDPLDNLLTPCFLYVDVFNAGAQTPIEDYGLRPYLQSIVDIDGIEHDNWDRYDYLGGGGNVPAPFARESSGDNGATKYQSMVYRHVLWNTGSFAQEGLRDGDADLLTNLLMNNDFGRRDFQKGLWLNGNGMPTILDNPGRPHCQNLLVNLAGAIAVCSGAPYHDPGCTADSSLCVRLDPTAGRDFPVASASYGSLRGNGCPQHLEFRVLGLLGSASAGNQTYVDQDGGEVETSFASVSNDQFASPANYGILLDAYSVHYLRQTPDGWTGTDCGTDSLAITERVLDALTWLGAAASPCDPADVVVSTPGSHPMSIVPARTMLAPNTPNPFTPRTTVRYLLADKTHVRLWIFDIGGRMIRSLVDGIQPAGRHEVAWNGATDAGEVVASGVYWVRMSTSSGYRSSTKMVILR